MNLITTLFVVVSTYGVLSAQALFFSKKSISACDPNPCKYNGTCKLDSSLSGGFLCECTSGFVGPKCEKGS